MHNNKYHKKSKNWVTLTIHGCLGMFSEGKVNFFLVNKDKTRGSFVTIMLFYLTGLGLKRIYYANYC